jgi:hypothetical protein
MLKQSGVVMRLSKLVAVFLLLLAVSAWAQDENGGIKTSTDLQFQISSVPEAKLSFSQSFIFPFMQGSGPLTRDNNINTVLTAEVTPVSLNGKAEITWTPAAFFLLSGGGLAGSGWNMPLGNGIGINRPEDENAPAPRKAIIDGAAFDGLLWRAWGAGTLQFDLGAIIPGSWNHVLFQSRQELRYAAYSRAAPGESWVYEGDYGENQNGWVYYASYVLGYQMPLSPVLNTVAFMAEIEKHLYNTPGGDYWGGNLGKWTFSGLFNFSVTPRFGMALVLQMQTRRNHGSSNFNNTDYYYRDFELKDDGGRRRLLFYRAALLLNYKIR